MRYRDYQRSTNNKKGKCLPGKGWFVALRMYGPLQPWIDMNIFSINPDLTIVDRDQTALIKLLERKGIDVIPLKLRHSKMLGGGFHCVTLDIRRKGPLQRYFD